MFASFLAAFYIILLSISLVGLILLFAAKGKVISLFMIGITGFISMVFALFTYQNAANAMAPTYAVIFSICLGLLSIIGMGAGFMLRNSLLPKILITIAFLGGFWGCGAVNSILSLF